LYPWLAAAVKGEDMTKVDFDETIYFCAFRYALGRRSYITKSITDKLIENWHLFTETTQKTIINSISHAIEHDEAGDHVDVQHWLMVIYNNQVKATNESL
jgi:hypothetical protein